MPCYSTVTQTQIIDFKKLISALQQLKIGVINSTDLWVQTDIGTFTRQKSGSSFVFTGTKAQLAPVGRQYANLTVRDWAARNGMSISSVEDQKITMQKRR